MDVQYSEKLGVHRSPQPAEQVHHIIPESQMIEEGHDPDTAPAIVLSKREHVGKGRVRDSEGEREAVFMELGHSYHPDMGDALEAYRNGDEDAFKKAARKHIETIREGGKVVNTDDQTDEFLQTWVNAIETSYIIEHPEDPKPVIHHKKPRGRAPSWWDIICGKRGYPEDEET
mgnify:CR=1 FL=1